MKMTILVGRCLKRKAMLMRVKEYINKTFATCKSLCDLQELYTAFKEKHPNVNIGLSKFCALRPKWCVLDGSKITHSVCVCSAYQNIMLLVSAMDWGLKIKKMVYNAESNKCIMHWCESCPGTATLNEFLLIRNSKNMKMIRNLITVSEAIWIKQYWQPLQPLTKNTKRL